MRHLRLTLDRISLAIWFLAFALRLTLIFGFQRQELGRPEPVRIAVSLANRGTFADPYEIPTGPTAHTAPLYPAMLAPIYLVFGDTRAADLARLTFSSAGASAEYALLPSIAAALGMPVGAGILAGLVGAIFPLQYWPECMGEFEATWMAVFLELSIILFARFMRKPSFTAMTAVRAGVWCGLGLLLAPNLLPPLIALLAIAFWRFRTRLVASSAIVCVVSLAVIAPWLARNYVQFGGLFFIRDDLGLELHMSNNDEARADEEENMGTAFFHREHPFMSVAAARRITEIGELRFEREHLRSALEWIYRNFAKFCRLTWTRVVHFWFPPLSHPLHRYPVWGLIVLAWAGLLNLSRTNLHAAIVLGSVLVSFPVIYYFVQNYLRYQHPIYWVFLLLAASNSAIFCSNEPTTSRPLSRF